MSGDTNDIAKRLTACLEAGISDEAMTGIKKAVDNIICGIEDDVMYRLKDDLAPNLTAWVVDMAKKSVEMLLEGNEDQMRRYLSCEKRDESGEYIAWTGRSDGKYWGRQREPHEWHPIIHGTMFEQGAVALRAKIVNAHAELLKTERVLDLEDQVKSLVAQVNKAKVEKDAMYQRLRDAS